LDIVTEDRQWAQWSSEQLAAAADRGGLVINPIIYSEVSIGFDSIEEMESLLSPEFFELRAISRAMSFLAGKCFVQYHRRGGVKTLPLPDFFIGAHAAIEKIPLLTRDPNRFATYFPTVEILAP